MKKLLTICLLVSAPFINTSWAAGMAVTGEILEIKEVDSYSYIRLKTKDGEKWAAVGRAPLKKGAQVTVDNAVAMSNFESKALKQTFPSIIFGQLAGAAQNVSMSDPHAGVPKVAEVASPINVAKASGANARTVAEVVTKASSLKDKTVRIRGKIVKYNPGIRGKNWIHLQDGTGTASNESNDILVTTTSHAKLGDMITVTGIVRTNKDFGGGYAYKVLIEEATLAP